MIHRILPLILFFALTGCTSAKSIFDLDPPIAESGAAEYPAPETRFQEESLANTYARLEAELRAELDPWQGTPHLWGGNTKQGVDCSGLIKRVYQDLLDMQTARTTGELIEQGHKVRQSRLKAGDLVFFSPSGKKGSHVGIYLSKGEFTHASSSSGVMTSNLANSYWSRHYETGRRIIEDEEWLEKTLKRLENRRDLAEVLQSE